MVIMIAVVAVAVVLTRVEPSAAAHDAADAAPLLLVQGDIGRELVQARHGPVLRAAAARRRRRVDITSVAAAATDAEARGRRRTGIFRPLLLLRLLF